MIAVGERVRITDGWARGKTALVVKSEDRFVDLEMPDGVITVYAPWRVQALGQRNPVRESTDRRMRKWRARGGVL